MINLNTRCIQAFLAVVAHQSFRKASDALNRSQSTVSAQVRQVEDAFGVALLRRTTRSVSVTEAGRKVALHSNKLVTDLDTLVGELRDEARQKRRQVVICCVPSISTNFLPPIIAEFQKIHPGVAVSVKEYFSTEMYDSMREKKGDFALGPRLHDVEGFAFRHVLDDPLVAVLPMDFPLNGRRDVRFNDIMHLPQLAMPKTTVTRRAVDALFRERGVDHTPKFEVTQQQTLFTMVEAGLGMTIMPFSSVPRGKQRQFQAVKLVQPTISQEVSLITRRGEHLSPLVSRCAKLVRDRLARAA